MTATKQIGESKRVLRVLRNGAMSLGLMMVSAYALADNVLQDVRYAAAPGGKVDITLQFASPVGDVQAFTTDSPPRIALDLPNTSNGLSTRRVVIGSGATSAVSAAEAGGRTRVVVDLLRPAGYVTRSSGNLLVLTVDAGVGVQTVAGNARGRSRTRSSACQAASAFPTSTSAAATTARAGSSCASIARAPRRTCATTASRSRST